METLGNEKNADKFECEICNFSCQKLCDWNRHVLTKKHKSASGMETESKSYSCIRCSKIYQTRTGLWKHNQKPCIMMKSQNPIEAIVDQGSPSMSTEMISVIVTEIHKQMGILDILKNSEEMVKNSQELVKIAKEKGDVPTTIHNTTNNAQFNVNLFLNEKCKDAINFTDFMNSITLDQNDLQTVIKNGHVEGSSKIIADMLEKLGVYRRPIHCTDLKRETVYIRENDEWEKEQSELPRIKKLANAVSHQVIQQSNVWHEKNPDFMQNDEKKEESLHIMSQVFGTIGSSDKKIVKHIMQQVEVNKSDDVIIPKKSKK
jgi:hypothetical protein